MKPYVYILRTVAERAGLQSVNQLATLPGMKAVYRVTIHYPGLRACDSVATLTCRHQDEVSLNVVYQGHFSNRPITKPITLKAYENFTRQLRTIQFDQMSDQEDLPIYGDDLCLVERGANNFVKGVIFAPQRAEGLCQKLLDAIQQHIPEAVREIK